MEPAIPHHLQHHPLVDKIRVIFREHWHGIRTRGSYNHPVLDFWQCQLTDDHLPDKTGVTHNLFYRQDTAFKFNVGLSFLLLNPQTQELRFFHSSYNNSEVFEKPVLIRNMDDWKRGLQQVYDSDILEKAKESRPSRWVFFSVKWYTHINTFLFASFCCCLL